MRETGPRIFSVGEANAMLPQVQQLLAQLRSITAQAYQKQDQVDLIELEALQPDGRINEGAQQRMDALVEELHTSEREFGQTVRRFEDLGCELKDLDRGLVDFYTHRDGELVYLCWKEGEDAITHWHPLEGGYAARLPL